MSLEGEGVDLRDIEAQVSSLSLSRRCSLDNFIIFDDGGASLEPGMYKTRNTGTTFWNGFLKPVGTKRTETEMTGSNTHLLAQTPTKSSPMLNEQLVLR